VARYWSLLFLLVPILGVLTFILGPPYKIWLPVDISEHGRMIDHLFYFILWLTGAVFVVTEVVMFWFMWRYEAHANHDPVKFSHGSHSLEVVWTILPAATLLFIAIYQMNAWADSKMRKPQIVPLLEVTGRQFEWRLRYPGKDNLLGTRDDVFVVNDLHLPVNEEILLDLKSLDVLHSFFLPNCRVKQDAVPGMKIPVWFRATQVGHYDLVCAELCGWGHYKMKGRLTLESRGDFDEWINEKYREQEATQETQQVAAREVNP
jgi:cytochrome c oxidase subunit 2